MDEGCIRYILQCTSEHASELVPKWSLSEEEEIDIHWIVTSSSCREPM